MIQEVTIKVDVPDGIEVKSSMAWKTEEVGVRGRLQWWRIELGPIEPDAVKLANAVKAHVTHKQKLCNQMSEQDLLKLCDRIIAAHESSKP